MRKREGMKKRRSRILAWLLACFMVLSVIQGTGWGSLTVQAEETVNRPTTLSVGNNNIITEDIVSETTEGDGWSYDAVTNTLTLTNANLGSITYDGGDLNLQINGENTISTIDANEDSLYITGTKKDKLNGDLYDINIFAVENIEVNVSGIIAVNIIKVNDANLSSKDIDVKTFSCSESLIKASGYIYIKESVDCSNSELISDELTCADAATKKYTNSVVVDNSKNVMRIYGTATLCEDLKIPSNYTIRFAEGASITNLDKLTVNEGAKIYVNYRVDEDGFDYYDVHKHNTDGGVTCEWKDADTHVQKSVCKDCPVAYIAETEQESHQYNAQGFCTECDAYQPAVLTTDQYDIDSDGSKEDVYEISNAGQLYWFAGLVNGTLPGVNQNTSANAVLTNDITVNENVLVGGKLADDTSGFRNWTPIADNLIIDGIQYGYSGIFDGQNHSISGIYCNIPYIEGRICGFFVYIGLKSIVRDFSVKDSYITCDDCTMLGGITGQNNGKIQGCSFDGLITGNSYIGGICGTNSLYGNITECYNYGEVIAIAIAKYDVTVAGGICAQNHSTVTKSGNYGNVKADQSVGGITGDNGGSIVDCYNQGNVNMSSGGYWVGGICGYMDDASITNGYNVGNVTGSGERGEIYGYLQGNNNIVTNCYYLSDTEIDDNKDMAGKTKEQFASGKVAYLLQEKCKDAVWGQTLSEEGGEPYPVLDGKKVYQNISYDSCVEDENKIVYTYSNEEKKTAALGHDYVVSEEKTEDGTSVTLTVVCQREGCTEQTDKHGGTVTLTVPDSLTYDGTAKEVTVRQSPEDAFDSVKVSYEYAWDGDSAYDKPVYAGDYTATVTVRLGEEEASASIDYTIQKAKLSVVNAEAAEKTYDGTTKVQITNVLLDGALKNDEVEVDTTDLYGDLSNKNAGTYSEITLPEMELVGAEADNYELIHPTNPVELATDVTIDKASMNLEDVFLTSVYTGQKLRVNLDALLPADCGAITYGNVNCTGVISYEGKPVISDDDFLTFVTKSGNIEDAGRIAIDVSTTNYTDNTIIIDIKLVEKIPVCVKDGYAVSVKNASLTYGQTLSILKFEDVVFEDEEGNVVKGTLAWKNPDKVPEYGTHSEEWIFTPEDSIYGTAEGTISVSVEKAMPEVTELPTVTDRVYHPGTKLENSDLIGGKVLHVDGTEMPGSWWVIDKSVLTVDKQEYQVRFQPSDLMDKTNYIYPDRMITVNVTKATPYITEIPTAETLTYGETLKDAALTGGKVQYSADEAIEVAGIFTWKLADTKPTVADSDSTNYIVVFTPDDSVNYATVETQVCVTVQKAPKVPNMPEASMDVDYTKTTVGSVSLPTGWKFEDSKLDTALEIDKPVTVTANYVGEDAGNYEVESVEITLTRKACTHPTTKWIVDKEATVDAEGSRHKECTVCKTVLATETIAKLEAPTPDVTIRYTTHVQTYGWQGDENNANKWFVNGKMAGTSGKAKRLEGIKIRVYGNDNLGIQYTTHCQSYGWLPWSANGEMNGTEGEAKRLEAIKIQLTGAEKDKYDVYYRVHAQTYGWLGWAKNGAPAGTVGYAKRLEGIQIVVVKKGSPAPGLNYAGVNAASGVHQAKSYIAKSGSSPVAGNQATSNTNPSVAGERNVNIAYRTHVQTYGWQGWKYNGQMSGTSGQAKRLEGINIKLTNKPYNGSIVYTTHVQTYGWQGNENNQNTWKRDGAMSGTSGQAKRLEAIRIALTGEMAAHYDVYYRVHAQSYGWLNWAKNGEAAGTAGLSKRLEGIQIVLVPKGGTAPANNYGGVVTTNKQVYIKK